VEDTGEAGWVQVKSKQKLEKFTDMSVQGVTIYRANNPKVLKTAAAQIPGTFMMSDIIAKYPDSLIMNTSGFDMNTGQIVGFQINNGQYFQTGQILPMAVQHLLSIKMAQLMAMTSQHQQMILLKRVGSKATVLVAS
jgi:exopolysaccharide biosynthesis protein